MTASETTAHVGVFQRCRGHGISLFETSPTLVCNPAHTLFGAACSCSTRIIATTPMVGCVATVDVVGNTVNEFCLNDTFSFLKVVVQRQTSKTIRAQRTTLMAIITGQGVLEQ